MNTQKEILSFSEYIKYIEENYSRNSLFRGLKDKSFALMIDGEPIAEIDNSLKELYSSAYMNKFDGFGDYAGISASLPSTGGAISPVGIYYSNENNYFIAYKGRAPQLSEFPLYIAPQIVNSEYWKEYGEAHHKKCPGCLEIEAIVGGIKSGRNQAQWKMITMLHYIYTMYEVGA